MTAGSSSGAPTAVHPLPDSSNMPVGALPTALGATSHALLTALGATSHALPTALGATWQVQSRVWVTRPTVPSSSPAPPTRPSSYGQGVRTVGLSQHVRCAAMSTSPYSPWCHVACPPHPTPLGATLHVRCAAMSTRSPSLHTYHHPVLTWHTCLVWQVRCVVTSTRSLPSPSALKLASPHRVRTMASCCSTRSPASSSARYAPQVCDHDLHASPHDLHASPPSSTFSSLLSPAPPP